MRHARFLRNPYVFPVLLAIASLVLALTGHDAAALVVGAVVSPQTPLDDTSSLNTVSANFLEWVQEKGPYSLIWDNNQTLTTIAKKTDIGGQYSDVPVKYGGSQGISMGNYGAALGNQTPEQQATFHVPMAELFAAHTVDLHAIEASRQRKGAFVPLATEALETSVQLAANEISKFLLGTGTATIGKIAAIEANPPNQPSGAARIILSDDASYFFFEYLMTLDSTLGDGSPPLGAPDTVQVLEVDASAGWLVLSAPINSSTGAPSGAWGSGYWVPGNFLIRDGNYNSNKFSDNISTLQGNNPFSPMNFAGIGAWCPSAAYRKNPGLASGQFFNVMRNRDGTKLAGQAVDGSREDNLTALTRAVVLSSKYNPMGAEYCTIGTESYNAVMQQMQGQKLYVDDRIDANILYEKVLILQGGKRPCKLIPDPWMPPMRAYFWSPGDLELQSTGRLPRPLPDANGNSFRPMTTQNGAQIIAGGYGNLVSPRPRNLVNVTLQQ